MSVRNGLIAFGMSAAVAAGGAASIHEAFQQADRHALEESCAMPANVGKQACQGVLTSPEALVNSHTGNQVYGWMGGILMVGGVLGLAAAYEEITESDEVPVTPTPRPRQDREQA
jgi:hypothetical protein